MEEYVSSTMRAYVSTDAAPLILTNRPVPAPGPDEVLVRTRAASLNNADLTASGDGNIAGFEFAGEVVEVGSDAPAHLRGARVMGIAAGAFAEVVVAHHRHVVVMPEALPFDEAATLPTALATEHGALTLGSVGPATSVLVTAASSGLGLIGVQVAKALGAATVVATTRSPGKRPLLERVGADAIVVTSREDLAAGTRDATGGDGADVVLDHVGGDHLADALEAACDGGEVISVGRLGGARASIDLFVLARRHVRLRSVSYGVTPPSVLGDLFDALAPVVLPAVTDGRIRAIIDRSYDFDEAHAALERLASGQAEGKVVLHLG
jgi:NADPH2:quinone reductase